MCMRIQLAYVNEIKKRKQRTYKYGFLSTVYGGQFHRYRNTHGSPRVKTPLNNNALSAVDDGIIYIWYIYTYSLLPISVNRNKRRINSNIVKFIGSIKIIIKSNSHRKYGT